MFSSTESKNHDRCFKHHIHGLYHEAEKHLIGNERFKIEFTIQYRVSDHRTNVRDLIVIGWKLRVENEIQQIGRHHIRLNEISNISALNATYFMCLFPLLINDGRMEVAMSLVHYSHEF